MEVGVGVKGKMKTVLTVLAPIIVLYASHIMCMALFIFLECISISNICDALPPIQC